MPVGSMPRARFGTTRQAWRESVVTGTKGRLRRRNRQAQQIVFAHQPQHPLAVDRHSLAAELRGDPPVTVMTMRQRDTLDRIAHRGFLPARCRGLPVPVITGAADAGQRAQALDPQSALRQRCRHRFDERVDGWRQTRRSAGAAR
jgi:hypothetical protein